MIHTKPQTTVPSVDILMLPLGAAQLGGAERSIGELSMQLHAQGKTVQMLADRALENTPYAAELRAGGVPTAWMDWHPAQSRWHNFRLAWRVFRHWRAPLIHFNVCWRRGMWVVPLAAKLANPRAKLVGTIRSMPDPHHEVARKRYFGLIPGVRLWRIPARFNGWIWGHLLNRTVSINRLDFPPRLAGEYFFPAKNIRIIQNGIPIRTKPLRSEEKLQLRQQAGIAIDQIFLLYAGRLAADKGLEELLQAFAQQPQHYRLVIIGSGPLLDSLTALAEQLKINTRVNFLGFQPNPRDWMAAADIVITPSSEPEAFGRTVIEAMAESTVGIASRAGGMGEIYEDGVHGLYFPPRDAPALAQAIHTLGENTALRQQLAQQGHTLFLERYSVDRVREQYQALYSEILTS